MSVVWRDRQVWTELHDLEQRVGRIEAGRQAEHEAKLAVEAQATRQRERNRWIVPVSVSTVSVGLMLANFLGAFK